MIDIKPPDRGPNPPGEPPPGKLDLMAHGHDDIDAAVAALYEAARKNEQSAPRKHHLVLASYLVRWAADKRVRMTFTTTKKTVLIAPAKAARETDFYLLAGDGDDPDGVPPLLLETVLRCPRSWAPPAPLHPGDPAARDVRRVRVKVTAQWAR